MQVTNSPLTAFIAGVCSFFIYAPAQADLSGFVGVQARGFLNSPAYPNQSDNVFSATAEPEWYFDWNKRSDSVIFKPFARLDSEDSERTHIDIRELFWLHAGNGWEFGAGIGKVYWGVTESQHLVDIVNQTDLVESPDGEDKLGQPMVRYTKISDWGVVDAFILPGFRSRTFPGKEGRLRGAMPVDADHEEYESSAEEKHVDYALRWSHSIGLWDVGVSWFDGTSREPDFRPNSQGTLTPYYPQINRAAVDAQLTAGSWLWKFEGIHQTSSADDYSAFVGGFEYTFVGIFDTYYDIGWLLEYSWDDRDELSSTGLQNDVFVGGRFAFNDEASSEILFGVIQDIDYSSSQVGFIETSTRIGNASKIYLEARLFNSNEPADSIFQIKEDSYIELTYEYYF